MTGKSNEQRDGEMPATRADRLLNAIDFEIGLSERRNQRPGWTRWAIYGSIGVLSWTLLSLFEKRIPFYNSITVVVLLAFLLFDFVTKLAEILAPFSDSDSRTLQSAGKTIGTARQLILLHLLREVLILYLAWSERWCAPHAFYAVLVNYGFASLLFAGALAISFTDVIIPTNTTGPAKWTRQIFELVGLTLKGLAMTGFLLAAIHWHLIEPHNLRIAGLFVVGVWLLERIAFPIHPPLENTLVDLRRSLAFDKINVTSATGQFDVIVTGLKVSHVLQREISTLLASFEESAANSQLAATETKALSALIAGLRDRKTDLDQTPVVHAAIAASVAQHLDIAVAKLESSKKGYIKVLSRARRWQSANPSLKGEIDLLEEKMDSAWNRAIDAAKATFKDFEAIEAIKPEQDRN